MKKMIYRTVAKAGVACLATLFATHATAFVVGPGGEPDGDAHSEWTVSTGNDGDGGFRWWSAFDSGPDESGSRQDELPRDADTASGEWLPDPHSAHDGGERAGRHEVDPGAAGRVVGNVAGNSPLKEKLVKDVVLESRVDHWFADAGFGNDSGSDSDGGFDGDSDDGSDSDSDDGIDSDDIFNREDGFDSDGAFDSDEGFDSDDDSDDRVPPPVPAPAALLLFGSGALMLLPFRRSRRRRA